MWDVVQAGEAWLVSEIDRTETNDEFGAFAETTALGGFKTRLAITPTPVAPLAFFASPRRIARARFCARNSASSAAPLW